MKYGKRYKRQGTWNKIQGIECKVPDSLGKGLQPTFTYLYCNMNIQQTDDGKKGAFYIEENGERLAEMTYVWAGTGMFIIDHTEVSDKLAGKGAGKQLVAKAVDFAREQNVKIKPLCPFANSVFKKVQEYSDVL